MKCITHDCPNCSNEGEGRTICVEPDDDGWICEPCWTFLTKSYGRLNQIYKNAKEVAEQRQRDRDHYYAGQAAAMDAAENEIIGPSTRQAARAALSPGHPPQLSAEEIEERRQKDLAEIERQQEALLAHQRGVVRQAGERRRRRQTGRNLLRRGKNGR